MKIELPDELLQVIKTNIEILFEAITADEHPEQQIAYRKMAAIGTEEGKRFQVITEICIDEDFFLTDGDIEILTHPMHKPEPYKTMPPQSLL